MYHSDSGGCCDCGDLAAWKEEGCVPIAYVALPVVLNIECNSENCMSTWD